MANENINTHKNKTVNECKAICDSLPDCVAFEYGVDYQGSINDGLNTGECRPNKATQPQIGTVAGNKPNIDLYVK